MAESTINGPFKRLTIVERDFMPDQERADIAQAAASILLRNDAGLRDHPRELADEIETLTGILSDEALWVAPAEIFPSAA